jgi:uncharacterized protein YndB with AHSA1/START domain
VERTVTINRPVEEVFEYISTPENEPTWIPAALRHERTSPGPMRVGMTTEEDVKFLGRTASFSPSRGAPEFRHAVEVEPRGIYYKALGPWCRGRYSGFSLLCTAG